MMKKSPILLAVTIIATVDAVGEATTRADTMIESSVSLPQHERQQQQQSQQPELQTHLRKRIHSNNSNSNNNNNNSHNHQNERSLASMSYCGSNWQAAFDSCNKPCTLGRDEVCGPGQYCFGYVECTPPPSAQEEDDDARSPQQFGRNPNNLNSEVVGTSNPWEPNQAGSNTNSNSNSNSNNNNNNNNYNSPSSNFRPNMSPTTLINPAYMPAYIASLPIAPSNPYATPQPFSLPPPTPNIRPNPTNNFCGYGWESASNECFHACPSGKDNECPNGKTCHSWLTCTPSTVNPATFNVCGRNWAHAASTCARRCFLGDDSNCNPGETCFGGVTECEGELPPLTAVDAGLEEKSYTVEEIKALLDEEIANEREEEAMSDTRNWWCGTSWSNMLETCSRRCTSDDDCKPNAWTDGFCFKTPGGIDNCSTPGRPVKAPVPPGSRWCGRTWNDMLETCDRECTADEDCGYGEKCWVAPGTCKYVGVPVKAVSDPSTLWCGVDYDDAMTSCVKACPGETDEECPFGTSCFSGSSCVEEGEEIVR
mmetsp:Transcript_28346/g.60845  ORF Transcript_28346/g.60845 Transcript_28346/m.60845 type:complete len:538 (+) Transcript_28346:85-1698(+)